MSVDVRARAAAAEARRAAERAIDPVVMLGELHRIRRRRMVAMVTSSIVLVAAVVGGAVLIAQPAHHNQGAPAVTSNTPPPDRRCVAHDRIRCLGATSFQVALRVPVTFRLPTTFDREVNVSAPDVLDVYRSDVSQTGVSVIENATPVKNDSSWSRDPAAGRNAAAIATWLKNRPFLTQATLTRTTLGGLPAWRVSAQLKPGASLPAPRGEFESVAPTFISGAATAGYKPGLSGDYTLVDVPRAGVTVIWSWSGHPGKQALTGNQAFIAGISFG
jgi:hypothetical protein